MWISLYAGFLLALPVVLYQLWSFFAPAFAQHTQRVVVGLAAFAAFLGAGGLAFGYFVALPAAVHFLTNYDSHLYEIQIRAKDYLSFATVVLFAVAIVFESADRHPRRSSGIGDPQLREAAPQPPHRLRHRWRPSPSPSPASTRSRRRSRWCRSCCPLRRLDRLSVLLERRQPAPRGRYSERPMARAAVKAKAKQGKAGAQPAKTPRAGTPSGAGTRAAATRTRISSS